MVLLMAFWQLGQPLQAATLLWNPNGDGSAGSNTWDTTSTFWTGPVAWSNATPDDAVFGGTGGPGTFTVTLGEAITAGFLQFDTNAYTIDTSTFGLTLNSGITANEDATIQSGVGGSMILGGNNAWNVADSKTLTLASDINGTGFGITKSGAGSLTLSGANSFDGGVSLDAGILNINSASALGTGTLVVNGGVIDNTSGGAIVNVNNNVQTWAGDFTFTGSNDLDLGTGAVTLSADRTVTVTAGALTIGGSIGEASAGLGIIKEGEGTLVLAEANSFTGNLQLNAGTLSTAGGGANSLGIGAATITLNGGTLHLKSDATADYNRATTVTADSTILVGNFTADLNPTDKRLASLSIGANTLTVQNNGITSNGNTDAELFIDGTTTMTGDATFNVVNSAKGTTMRLLGDLEGAFSVTKTGSGVLLYQTNAKTYSGGTTVEAGTLQVNAGGTYLGDTTINGGTLLINTADGLGGAGSITTLNAGTLRLNNQASAATGRTIVAAGTSNKTLNLRGNANRTFDIGTFIHEGGTFTISANKASNNNTSNDTLTFQNDFVLNGNLVFNPVNGAGNGDGLTGLITLAIDGNITEGAGGPYTLTKNGNGTVLLNTVFDNSGNTIIDNGIMMLGVANALASGAGKGDFFFDPDNAETATFDLNGFDQTVNGISSDPAGTGFSVIDNTSGTAATLTVGDNDGVGDFQGIVQGNLSLTKIGAGTITFSGNASTFTGSTNVDAGVLVVDSAALVGTSAVNVGTSTGNATLSFELTGTGSIMTLATDANLTLGSASTFGNLLFQLGADTANSDQILLQGTGVLSANAGGGLISGVNLGTFGAGDYDLITGPNAIVNLGNFGLGSLPGGFTYTITEPATGTLRLTSTAVGTGNLYWAGDVDASWATLAGGDSNWSTSDDGLTNANYTPGAATTVIFSGTTSANHSTTLDNVYSVAGIIVLSVGSDVVIASGNAVGSLIVGAGGIDVETGRTLDISAAVVGTGASITKKGAGTLTLSGANTFDGGVTLDAGTLNINSAAALGLIAGTFDINGGVLDNTSGAAVVLSTDNPQTWDGDFTFTGTNDLDLGAGDVTLGADRIVTISAGILAVEKVTGAFGLTKEGAGILELGEGGDYSGVTTVNAGVLQASSAQDFSPNSAFIINAGGTLRINNQSQEIGSLAGSGIVENGGGGGTDILTVGGDNSSTVFSGTLQDGASGFLRLDKVGTGTLELSGTSTNFSNHLIVNGGILKITGTIDNVAGGTGVGDINAGFADNSTGMIYITGTVTTDTITLGNGNGIIAGGRKGSLVIDGGNVTLTALAGAGLNVGSGGYGYFGLRSGSLTGNRLESVDTTPEGAAVYRIDGGTLTSNEFILLRNKYAEFTITGGQVLHNAANQSIAPNYQNGGTAVMNISGGVLDNTGESLTFGLSGTRNSGYTGVLNLNTGGNLITNRLVNIQRGSSTTTVNFNGGTLTAAINETDFFNSNSGLTTYVHSGGAIINTAGSQVTISEALLAPTGDGLTGLTVSNPGSGYIGAPYLNITGDGTGATGYAIVDLVPGSGTFGQVTGVVITNPGSGYTNASVELVGGGATTPAVIDTPIFAANVSGGLTKQGAGTLTLTGNSTYTGGTTLTGGTLALGVNDALVSTGTVTVQGGATFELDTFTNTVGQMTLEDGIISGSTGVLTSTADYDLRKGSVSGILAGNVGVNKTTGDTVTLSGANTFTGTVSVTGGALAFDAAANLGDAANTVSVDGGTLSFTGITTQTRSGGLTIGTGGATLDAAFGAGTLELTGGITATSGTSNLTKTGGGTITVTGTTDLMGSAVSVSGGILNAGFSASGISGVTVAGGATLNLFDGATVTTAITTLNLADGSSLGFDLNAPGTSDVLSLTGSPTLSGTISVGLTDLGGLAVGTYDLINIDSGALTDATWILNLAAAPSGFNFTFDPTFNGGQTLRLTASTLNLVYWQGDVDGRWNTNSGPGNTNWSSLADGSADLGALPDTTGPSRDTLVFSAANASGPSISTTLEQDFNVDSLQFIAAPSGISAFTIAQGGAGTLTLTPQSANNGIAVADNAGAVTLSAPLATGANQTWEVLNTGSNNSSLTLSGNVAFNHAVTKTGEGVLTLTGTNTGAGGLIINGGTLEIGNDEAFGTGTLTINPGVILDATGGARTLTNNNLIALNGSFAFTGSNTLDLGTGTVTMGNNAVVTVAASALTIGGAIGDGGSNYTLTKDGAGILFLNGANTHGGGTTLAGGTLNLGNAAALGSGTFTIGAGTTLDNTSGGMLTLAGSPTQVWQGDYTFTGTNDLNLGTGGITLENPVAVTVTAGVLTVGGVIDDDINAYALTKLGTGTLVLNAVSTYDGRTLIYDGTLKIGVDDALPTDQVVELGSGGTAGTLDLGTFNQTIAGLEARSTTDTVTNNLIINAGKTLSIEGGVVLGGDASASSTKVVASGSGSLVVNSGGADFQVGGSSSTASSNSATVDFSGLTNFTADLGLGILKVGDLSSTVNNSEVSSLRLATNNTITAGLIAIGEGTNSNNANNPHSLILGSGTNILNSNIVAVGSGSNGNGNNRFRSSGEIIFDPGDTTGTLKIRSSDGVSAAQLLVMGNSTSSAGQGWTSTINFTGHAVDVLVNDVTMARRTQGGSTTATLSVDQGTFQLVDDLVMAHKVTTGNGDATATLNIGGTAIFIVGDDTTMSLNTGDSPSSVTTATINVTGGSATFNGVFNMANAAVGQTANSNINITGGILTSIGNITRTGGDGTENAVITLDGGTLDMTDNNIGTGTNLITFNAQSGTLQNINQLNGGGDLTKSTTGTLILEGVNDYAGNIIVSAGTLQLGSGVSTGSVNSAGTITVASGATFAVNQDDTVTQGTDFSSTVISGDGHFDQLGTGTTVLNLDNTYAGTTTVTAGVLQLGEGGFTGSIDSSSGVMIASGANLKTNRDGAIALNQVISGDGSLEVANAATGVTVLSGANTYAGGTTVSSGTLEVNNSTGSGTGMGSVTVSNTGSKLSGTGSMSGSTIIGSGTVLAPGSGDTTTGNGTLTFTAATTSLSVADSAQIQLGVTDADSIDGSFASWYSANSGLTAADYVAGVNGGAGTIGSWNDAPTGDHDFITAADTIILGSTVTGDKRVSVTFNAISAGTTIGSVFNLLDWSTLGSKDGTALSAMSGGGNAFSLANLELDAFSGALSGLAWDTSLFDSHGILVVVPEPSRALLLMFGLLGLMLRRRRK